MIVTSTSKTSIKLLPQLHNRAFPSPRSSLLSKPLRSPSPWNRFYDTDLNILPPSLPEQAASCRVLHSSFFASLSHSFMNETLLWITGTVCIWNKRIPEKNVRRREDKKYVWGNNLLSSRFIFIWINSQIFLCLDG